jgi:hypothetical protein
MFVGCNSAWLNAECYDLQELRDLLGQAENNSFETDWSFSEYI